MPLGLDIIQNRFGFHKGTIEGPNATAPRHASLREQFVKFAMMLDNVLPDGREKDLALTQLEDASMWAHKSVAREAPLIDEGNNDKLVCEDSVLPSECFGPVRHRMLIPMDSEAKKLCDLHYRLRTLKYLR